MGAGWECRRISVYRYQKDTGMWAHHVLGINRYTAWLELRARSWRAVRGEPGVSETPRGVFG